MSKIKATHLLNLKIISSQILLNPILRLSYFRVKLEVFWQIRTVCMKTSIWWKKVFSIPECWLFLAAVLWSRSWDRIPLTQYCTKVKIFSREFGQAATFCLQIENIMWLPAVCMITKDLITPGILYHIARLIYAP